MQPLNITYSILLMLAGIACLLVAVVVWYVYRASVGARPLVVFLLALSWWDITYAVFWANIPGPTPYFWLDITLVGAFIVPTAFLIFSLEFSNLQQWLKRPVLLALMIEPILVFTLLWTDPWHNLYFGGKRALNTVKLLDAGPVSWANIYYSYFLILLAVAVLVVTYFRSVGIYRKQIALVLAAVIVPWVVHIAFVISGGLLLADADITPFIFTVTALIIAFALTRYHLMDILPIARSVLIENMQDCILVLDKQSRIVDVNPSVLDLLKVPAKDIVGQGAAKIFSAWPDIVENFSDLTQARSEVKVGENHYDLRISPLLDSRNQFVGRLMVWRDVTDFKNTQAALEKLVGMDELTQIHNRRFVLGLAEAEIKRAARLKQPLALALIDIDHFKHINDTYGHPTGDRILVAFVNIFRENVREFDTFARFGGEEFALLMPGTDSDQAYQVCERLRLVLAQTAIALDTLETTLSVQVSLGIAEFAGEDDSLELLLHRADQALYIAKQAGRNRTVNWQASLLQ